MPNLLAKIFLFFLCSTTWVSAANQTLWKEWYLLTSGGKAIGFYEETAEKRPAEKQISVTQKWVEREGTLAETYIGTIVADDGKLTPVAFFRERKQAGREDQVDGRAKNGSFDITVKLASGKEKKSALLKPGTYLSNVLSIALAEKKPSKDPFAFQAIVEDVRDGDYQPKEGAALISETTKKIRGFDCRKITVEFNGQAEWWIASNGRVCEINAPVNGTRIALSTEKEAKKALGFK